jgi:hypothetical protein
MTEEELKEKLYKDLKDVLDINSVINFLVDMSEGLYMKGVETGIAMGNSSQLTKAKELIKALIDDFEALDGEQVRELKTVKEAEQFLKGR